MVLCSSVAPSLREYIVVFSHVNSLRRFPVKACCIRHVEALLRLIKPDLSILSICEADHEPS